MSDLPRWIESEELCLWCRKAMPISTAYLGDEEEAVYVWYSCTNEQCEHTKRFNTPAKYGTQFTGNYPIAWKKFFEEKEQQESKTPSTETVPMAEKVDEQEK